MKSSLTADALDAWRSMLFASSHVVQALGTDMEEQHGLPITWFDVLGRLRQAPEGRLRMHEMEEQSVFTRSGITRLADRIENAGLIERVRSSSDRRGVYLRITDAGIEKLDEVWPDHQQSIWRHFARHLDASDLKALQRAAQKLRAAQESRSS
ncbi:MAG: MarR family transcriptional regulator [Actinomycetota bacterium]|nr:MarR family transcriptional regulator [Actinomycetota bacterium]